MLKAVLGRKAVLGMMMAAGLPGLAAADDAWIRIEAKRGPAAEAAIAGWKAKFDDVQSFALPNGMTGIALGPLDAAAAAARMAKLKAEGAIPADSYLTAPGGTAPLAGVIAAAAGTPATEAAAASEGAAPAPEPAATATTGTHIQLQATPGRISAGEALAHWRETFPEAGLWRLPGGMFAVALAPQEAQAAADRLAALKAEGKVPSDAYLSETAKLGQVIEAGAAEAAPTTTANASDAASSDHGPAGATTPPTTASPTDAGATPEPAASSTADASPAVTEATPAAGADASATDGDTAETTVAPAAEAAPATPAPAAASTAGLTQPAAPAEPPAPAVMPPLEEVQSALRWAGFYDGAIDGKSGPGTRAAIDKEIEATAPGTPPAEAMTALIARREAWRRDMGLETLTDEASGLQILAPTARLAFDRVERGLSIYGPKDGSGAALILTRQPGGQQEMLDFAGLVTALGWVPHPKREAAKGAIALDGADDRHHGHAEARVDGDHVEGWVLIWPAADADNARKLALELAPTLAVTPTPEPAAAGATATPQAAPAN